MRRWTMPEALLLLGTAFFMGVGFLALELQRHHHARIERMLRAGMETSSPAAAEPTASTVLSRATEPAAAPRQDEPRKVVRTPRASHKRRGADDLAALTHCDRSDDPMCGVP